MSSHVVVVGGGMAAARTCEQLRRQGLRGQITLLSAEDRLPYDRPPLSKAALHAPTDTTFPIEFDQLGVEVRLNSLATGLDVAARVVHTASGPVHFDQLVIATGADPIRLPGLGEQLTLRTAADADQLRERLVPGAHVVVVGASWIGAEVATAALSRGARVTCIEAGAAPYAQALGAEAGLALLHWWHEVELRLGVGVRGVEVRGVEPALATAGGGVLELTDGAELVADVVVSGVGVRPATSWLTGSGLTLDPAVVVDEHLRTSVAGIVALGDVASWWSARWQRHLRVMHWDDAQAAPAVAAASLLADSADDIADGGADVRPDARAGGPAANSAEPYDPVPYFWSDQFGHKLQYVGHHEQTDQLIRRTAADGELEGIGWLQPSGELTAYLAIDRPRHILHARRAIMRGAQPDPSRLADPAVPIAEL